MIARMVIGIGCLGLLGASTPANPFKPPPAAVVPPPAIPPPVAVTTSPASTEAVRLASAARGLRSAKARAAWQAVLAVDGDHSEALFFLAADAATAKRDAEARGFIEHLAKKLRPDAVEFLIEARRHAAFARLRGDDAAFRALLGIGAAATTDYERLMGHGGGWEQVGTACDKAEVALQLQRSRGFSLRVATRCQGDVATLKFRGTWRLDAAAPGTVTLAFGKPGKGGAVPEKETAPCTLAPTGDEYVLACTLDEELSLVMLPVRR